MAGIYIHIPFCKQACHYCNFHFSTSLQYKNELLRALLNEIELRKDECNEPIDTVYFGGGTPGLLSLKEINDILNVLKERFDCLNVLETTIEMNPDDVSEEKVKGLKNLGVDRISLGVQSFYEEDLIYMNRSHDARKAEESIEIIQQYFDNYTVDLIYGYPLLSDDKLSRNVSKLLNYNVPHISIYGMTVEPKTALDAFIKKGREVPMDSDQGARQFEFLIDELESNGYSHYEISSYAKVDHRAKHNSNYWSGKSYLGFGPGAHSFQQDKRTWNIANNALYIQSIDKNELPQEEEVLSATDMLNELVLLGLRVKEGLNLEIYKSKSSSIEFDILLQKANIHIKNKLLELTENHIRLSRKGRVFCDRVSADLFL
jgi:oxygen-independent coproporphyrinogen-3 oxidase